MSRPTSTASRQLSLTEELEKLEQSITLTLQEIDANFSKAHRIVTTSILPVIEQYGEHSRNLWDSSKFWKQFFEFSANCSLSNYEDVSSSPEDITEQNEERLPLRGGVNEDVSETPRPTHHDMDDDTLMTDNISGSTPRPPTTRSIRTHSRFADFGSPYEDLRQELKGEAAAQEEEFEVDVSLGSVEDNEQRPEETEIISDSDADESALLAIHTRRLPDFSMTPKAPTTTLKLGDTAKGQSNDPLLHRVLDKNYRIQATPIRRIYSPIKGIRQPEVASKEETAALAWDSPMSSPEIMAPKLRSAAFMSPIKSSRQTGISDLKVTTAPRTPGISVQTPIAQKQRDVFASARRVRSGNDDIEIIPLGRDIGTAAKGTKEKGKALQRDEIGWDSSDDDELYGGFSPPKTIQFAMPQSKLMQTPAREASKRIVDDILADAGMAPNELSDFSPSLVKIREDVMDDSF